MRIGIDGKEILFRFRSVAAGVHIRSLRPFATSSSCVGYLIVQDVKLLDCAYVDFAVIIYFLLLMYCKLSGSFVEDNVC